MVVSNQNLDDQTGREKNLDKLEKTGIVPRVRWQQLAVRTTIWLSAEIVLGMMGIDHLADYSEFLLQQQQTLIQVTEVVSRFIT